MKKWINVNHDFGWATCVLVLSAREAVAYRIREILTKLDNDPVKLEEAVTKVICELRPEFKGGQLVAMGMRGMQQMEFHYWHPSFPRFFMDGKELPEIPLIPPVNEPTNADLNDTVDNHDEPLVTIKDEGLVELPYKKSPYSKG